MEGWDLHEFDFGAADPDTKMGESWYCI